MSARWIKIAIVVAVLGVPAAAMAKKTKKTPPSDMCQATCVKNGTVSRSWTVPANTPAATVSAAPRKSKDAETCQAVCYHDGVVVRSWTIDPQPSESSKVKEAPKKISAEKTAVKSKTSHLQFSQLEEASGTTMRAGETTEQVRQRLGNPYIETTDANNDTTWIYTQTKTVAGNRCEVIKWKLIFKKDRLKEWYQPQDESVAGFCGVK